MPQCRDHLGKEYPSLAAMARAYGHMPDVLSTRLKRGWDLETALLTPDHGRRTGVCRDHLGNCFLDKKSMAEAYGIDPKLCIMRLKRGWSVEKALTTPVASCSPKICRDHLGREYPSISAMAREYGIDFSMLMNRLKAGLSLEDALTLPNFHTTKDHLGNVYPSKKAMLEAYGIHKNTFDQRIAAGASLEDALTAKSHALRKVDGQLKPKQDGKGNTYQNLKGMCDPLGISVSAYHTRKRFGIPIDHPNRIHPVKDHKGIEYPTLQAMLDAYKVSRGAYRGRKKRGWTPEECLLGRERKKSRPSKKEIIESDMRRKASRKDSYETYIKSIDESTEVYPDEERNKP